MFERRSYDDTCILGMLRLILLCAPHCSLAMLTPTSRGVAPFRHETRYTMVVIASVRVSARREVVSHSPPPIPMFVNKKSSSHKLSLQRVRRGFKSRRPRLLQTRTLDGLLHFSLSLYIVEVYLSCWVLALALHRHVKEDILSILQVLSNPHIGSPSKTLPLHHVHQQQLISQQEKDPTSTSLLFL